MSDWSGRRLHFIGIGGAGMSGLALVCARLGATVSGSDRSDSSYMERLRRAGLDPVVGHDAANLPDGAEVVVSTAIGAENPELALARERGIEPIHRGALLAELCAEKRLIAIAGTHGKTTTTAMAVWALRAIGADPAFFVGGEVPGVGEDGRAANAGWGEGEWVVAEADESDASFLELAPEIAVVTNVEMDHHTRWGSLAELHKAFEGFAGPATGVVLPVPAAAGEEGGAADPLYARIAAGKRAERFSDSVPASPELALAVPGRHNRANARGATRIYDDYAHHPTEVRAALSALRELEPRHLIAVFQPHLYSRTKALGEEFGAALALADEVAVLDVYPAREQPVGELAGVSGLRVAQAAAERGGGRPVWWLPEAATARRALAERLDASNLPDGTVLVTIGAGDIFKLGESLVDGS